MCELWCYSLLKSVYFAQVRGTRRYLRTDASAIYFISHFGDYYGRSLCFIKPKKAKVDHGGYTSFCGVAWAVVQQPSSDFQDGHHGFANHDNPSRISAWDSSLGMSIWVMKPLGFWSHDTKQDIKRDIKTARPFLFPRPSFENNRESRSNPNKSRGIKAASFLSGTSGRVFDPLRPNPS
ncbi:hypothetical protein BD779DRAFT_1471073 [Infundibulicybe gibba]|nr:hypothetical protein BD779DRAFT_1471073 [Infundibulicybe gibba]